MKKLFISIACVTLLWTQGSAQNSFKVDNPENVEESTPLRNLFSNDLSVNGNALTISTPKNALLKAGQSNSTGTEYRVMAATTMLYDGAQYTKKGDSTRYFFSGIHSFREIFGMDISERILLSNLSEINPSTFPQFYSGYDDHADSILTYRSKSGEIGYEDLIGRGITVFNVNGNISEKVQRVANDGVWANKNKQVYNYNSNNQIVEYIWQRWSSGTWLNYNKTISSYDVKGDLQEYTTQEWNIASWANSVNYIYQYDAQNNCIAEIRRRGEGTSWVNQTKYEISYNANNKITQTTYLIWENDLWVESENDIRTYDDNENLISYLKQNKNGNDWVNNVRYTYTYNNNQKTNYMVEKFDGTVWVKQINNIYTYTPTGKLEKAVRQTWDDPGYTWKNLIKHTPEYNNLDLLAGLYSEAWNTGGFWEKPAGYGKYKFFYESYENTGTYIKNVTNEAEISLYPNPVSNTLNVQIIWEQPQDGILTIYDLSGRKVMEQHISKHEMLPLQLNVSHLQVGSYYLNATTKYGQITKGFQVIR